MTMLIIRDPTQPEKKIKSDEDYQFIELLKSVWDDLHDNSDAFRYKVNTVKEKFVGKYLLQLNPERGSNRRMPEHMENIIQPFDPNKFNFTKVSAKEIIFSFKENHDSDIHAVLVNVSPISRYHSLLCPAVSKCLPQVVTQESLELCLQIMLLSKDRNLRIGFNSLCGFASVNHLHYHLVLINHQLPVETAECKHLTGAIYCLEDHPVPAFCFQVQSYTVKETSKDIYKLLEYFIENSIAHNIFITRGNKVTSSRQVDEKIPDDLIAKGNTEQSSKELDENIANDLIAKEKTVQSNNQVDEVLRNIFVKESKIQSNREVNDEVIRVLVWPRKSSAGIKPLGAFNIALCELSGWFPIYTKQDYDNLTTEDLEKELRKWKIDNFDEICEKIKVNFETSVS